MATSPPAVDWSAVIEANRDWIARLVVARTGERDLVDDVVQELGLAVARSNARPGSPEEMAPWLCKIVVRQCALAVRRQSRQRRKLDAYQQTRHADDTQAVDPILWLLRRERSDIVRAELETMDGQGRELLVWKYVQGLSYESIGSRLGVSRHVAEYRVIEARKALRRRLQARGIEGDDSP